VEPQNDVLALIPAWNEAGRIEAVIAKTRPQLPVLVVDDGSSDDSAARAEAAGATVIRHPQNRGKGVALTNGFRWALEHGYQAVLTLDADGQHDPADIPAFLEAHRLGAGDLIIGRRRWGAMPFPRRYTNPFGSWLLSLPLGVPVFDSQSGFRLHNRRCLETVDLRTTGFELETEIIIQAALSGLTIAWVPIQTLYGVGEISYFHPLLDTLGFFRMVGHAFRARWRAGRRGA
jgi:glycosyltransferase involved in cell wall biosynthesis